MSIATVCPGPMQLTCRIDIIILLLKFKEIFCVTGKALEHGHKKTKISTNCLNKGPGVK